MAHHYSVLMVLLCLSIESRAGLAVLPEPLSLDDAMHFSSRQIPVLSHVKAAIEAVNAEALAAASLDGVRLTAQGRLRWIEPSYKSVNEDRNDSHASLILQKPLYDSGYADHLQAAAEIAQSTHNVQTLIARQQYQLAIMRAFYDVLLADIAFARDNEAMSIAFVAADKARDRHELGVLSDVDLLAAESHYEQARRQRSSSAIQQRLTRAALAIAMGRPDDLANNLVMPEIPLPAKLEDDFSAYWRQLVENNPELIKLRASIVAAQKKADAARAAYGPVLSAELGVAAHNRSTASTHPVFAGLLLELPILSGGAKEAGIAKANAVLQQARADLLTAELRLRQEALEIWMRRQEILVDIEAFKALGDYRDLYLDRSRALYELEVRTDLGDAMTQTTAVHWRLMDALFNWAINQARLRALSGAEVYARNLSAEEGEMR